MPETAVPNSSIPTGEVCLAIRSGKYKCAYPTFFLLVDYSPFAV